MASERAQRNRPEQSIPAAASRLLSIIPPKLGTAVAAVIPNSTTTISHSINVNPRWCARDRMQLLPETFVMFIQYPDTKKPPRFYDKWRLTEDKRKHIPRSVIQIKRLPH